MLDLDRLDLKKILKNVFIRMQNCFFLKLINDKFLLCDIKIYKLLCGFLNERKNVKN